MVLLLTGFRKATGISESGAGGKILQIRKPDSGRSRSFTPVWLIGRPVWDFRRFISFICAKRATLAELFKAQQARKMLEDS
jgi:hypothetical protein